MTRRGNVPLSLSFPLDTLGINRPTGARVSPSLALALSRDLITVIERTRGGLSCESVRQAGCWALTRLMSCAVLKSSRSVYLLLLRSYCAIEGSAALIEYFDSSALSASSSSEKEPVPRVRKSQPLSSSRSLPRPLLASESALRFLPTSGAATAGRDASSTSASDSSGRRWRTMFSKLRWVTRCWYCAPRGG